MQTSRPSLPKLRPQIINWTPIGARSELCALYMDTTNRLVCGGGVYRQGVGRKGLVSNYKEGGYKTGGGACENLPLRSLRKGGGGVAMLKGGGGTTSFGVVLCSSLEVLAKLKKGGGGGGAKSFHSLKGGRKIVTLS